MIKSLYDVTVSTILLLVEGLLLLVSIGSLVLSVVEVVLSGNHMTDVQIVVYFTTLFVGTVSTVLLLKLREIK